MAFDEALADRIRTALADDPALTEKRMFGGLAFLHRGLMFVGVSGNKLMARVGKDNYADSLAHKHVREMDFTGKPMQGYVYVEPAGLWSDDELRFWLQRCKAFVSSLPAKSSKSSRRRP
jgi:TfoX/Sxy family transcriptional regulator of competence genes